MVLICSDGGCEIIGSTDRQIRAIALIVFPFLGYRRIAHNQTDWLWWLDRSLAAAFAPSKPDFTKQTQPSLLEHSHNPSGRQFVTHTHTHSQSLRPNRIPKANGTHTSDSPLSDHCFSQERSVGFPQLTDTNSMLVISAEQDKMK